MAQLRQQDIGKFIKEHYRLEGGRKLTSDDLKQIGRAALEHGALGKDYAKPFTKLIGGVANPISDTRFIHGAVRFHKAVEQGELSIDGRRLVARKQGVGPVTFRHVAKAYVAPSAMPPAPPKDDALLKRQRALRVQAIQQAIARGRQPQADLPAGGQGPNVGPLVGGRTGGTLPLTSVSRLDRGGPQPAATEPTVAPPPESDQPSEPAERAEGAPTEAPVGSLATTADQPEDAAAVPPTADDQTPSEEPPTEEPEDLEIG